MQHNFTRTIIDYQLVSSAEFKERRSSWCTNTIHHESDGDTTYSWLMVRAPWKVSLVEREMLLHSSSGRNSYSCGFVGTMQRTIAIKSHRVFDFRITCSAWCFYGKTGRSINTSTVIDEKFNPRSNYMYRLGMDTAYAAPNVPQRNFWWRGEA